MTSAKELLAEAIDTMEVLDKGEQKTVEKQRVEAWMNSVDIQVMGIAHYFISDRRYYPQIVPSLTFHDYHQFLLKYYERCLREDPQMEWADTMYTAGWSVVSWFMGIWRDPQIPREALATIRDWLAVLYKTSDERLRECLITATLEHLFEDRKVAKFFASWRDDDTLGMAYRDALLWTARGGRSELPGLAKPHPG